MAPKLVDHFDVPLDPGVRRETQPLLVPWFHVEFFDGVNGTVSPGPSAWSLDLFGLAWFGRKLVLHFCVVRTEIFWILPLLCV